MPDDCRRTLPEDGAWAYLGRLQAARDPSEAGRLRLLGRAALLTERHTGYSLRDLGEVSIQLGIGFPGACGDSIEIVVSLLL